MFYRKGLPEFLAACGVRGTSWTTVSQDTVLHEGASEGPRPYRHPYASELSNSHFSNSHFPTSPDCAVLRRTALNCAELHRTAPICAELRRTTLDEHSGSSLSARRGLTNPTSPSVPLQALCTHFAAHIFRLAVVKRRGCKPRLAFFALLKLFAPGFNPWMLFYKKGLREFLAACGVHEPSASAAPCGAVVAEGGAEGPRRPTHGGDPRRHPRVAQ